MCVKYHKQQYSKKLLTNIMCRIESPYKPIADHNCSKIHKIRLNVDIFTRQAAGLVKHCEHIDEGDCGVVWTLNKHVGLGKSWLK